MLMQLNTRLFGLNLTLAWCEEEYELMTDKEQMGLDFVNMLMPNEN